MKLVNFESIQIKNFLSIGDEPVQVNFTKGLNIITGINKDKSERRNGVGKSTVADAIYFAIFGDTLRDIKKENIANNVTNKQPEVIVKFNIIHNNQQTEYKIHRLLNPSKCYLYENDVDVTLDTISNTTKYISDLISATPELFQNCVIMTVNNTIPFMAKKKLEKRKFIESILNLEVFSEMLSVVRSRYNETQRELDIQCGKYEEISTQIQSLETQRTDQSQKNQERIEKIHERSKQNDEDIARLNEKYTTDFKMSVSDYQTQLDSLKSTLVECNNKYGKINNSLILIKSDNTHLTKSLKSLGTQDSTCPMCLQKVSDHSRELIEKERQSINDKLSTNKEQISTKQEQLKLVTSLRDKLEDKIDKIQHKINEQTIIVKDKDNILSKITQLQEWNAELAQELETLNNITDTHKVLIDELDTRLQQSQQIISEQKDQINLIDIARFVVSEEGVKSYIVRQIIQLLNAKLAQYLKKMDANCICVFNEYFEECIVNEKGNELSYFNFSGAEKKNIDLACLFAFMDIRRLQGDVAFNLNIYDELFDSSLDEKGVDLVVDILKERIDKFNETAIVISHRRDSTKIATGEIIFLEKKNGITTRTSLDNV